MGGARELGGVYRCKPMIIVHGQVFWGAMGTFLIKMTGTKNV